MTVYHIIFALIREIRDTAFDGWEFCQDCDILSGIGVLPFLKDGLLFLMVFSGEISPLPPQRDSQLQLILLDWLHIDQSVQRLIFLLTHIPV